MALVEGRLGHAEQRATQALGVWGDEVHPDARAWSVVHLRVLRLLQGRAGELGKAVHGPWRPPGPKEVLGGRL